MGTIRCALAAIALALATGFGVSAPVFACSAETDCMVGDRNYRIALPDSYDGTTPIGAILYNHGYRGSADGAMANDSMRAMANDLGVALIASEAADDDWDLPNAPRQDPAQDGAAELAYFDAVLADATGRFAIDPDKVMVTGFSAGGMVTWFLACHRGGKFMGFAPLAGTFWGDMPQTCESAPVNLIHVHGTSDTVVPPEGRVIADTRQGDVFEALQLMRSTGFSEEAIELGYDDRRCLRWRVPEATTFMDFCRHPGGHGFSAEDIGRAYRLMVGNG